MEILIKNAKALSAIKNLAESEVESQKLFRLLGDHATRKFAQRNGYVYNGNLTVPMDMFENTQDRLRSADVLCLPADKDLKRISAYVKANVLKYLYFTLISTRNSCRNLQRNATPGVVIRFVRCQTAFPLCSSAL